MEPNTLRKVVRELSNPLVLISSVSARGEPHIAAAGRVEVDTEGTVMLTEWFCPMTLSNLKSNPHACVVVWSPDSDTGVQLMAESTVADGLEMLNGYAGELEDHAVFGQSRRRVVLRVKRTMKFSRGPHRDEEIQESNTVTRGSR